MKTLKENFSEIFTLTAFVCLLAYILFCTITHNKTDSVRDAWNVIIMIASFVWGSQHKKVVDQKTTTEVSLDGSATVTTEPAKPIEEIK